MRILIILILIGLTPKDIFSQEEQVFSGYAVQLETGQERKIGAVDQPHIAASTWKVISLSAALDLLGPSEVFSTELVQRGNIDTDGVLHGDLIIKSSGDPSWNSKRFPQIKDVRRQLLDFVQKAGITCIEGGLFIDPNGLGSDPVSPYWVWEDLGNYYGSGSWCINYHDNLTKLKFSKGEKAPELSSVELSLDSTRWKNELTWGAKGSGDQAYVFGGPLQEERIVRGTLAPDMRSLEIKASLSHPPLLALQEMKSYLSLYGIQVDRTSLMDHTGSSKGKVIGVWTSPPLKDLVEMALKKSDNLYVEAILRKAFPKENYKSFLSSLEAHLASKKFEGFFPFDACGLSPFNRFSPFEGVQYLKGLISKEHIIVPLMPTIATSSLRRYTSVEGNIKSGYMGGVVSYIGYTKNGWVFCMMSEQRQTEVKKIRNQMGAWLSQL